MKVRTPLTPKSSQKGCRYGTRDFLFVKGQKSRDQLLRTISYEYIYKRSVARNEG